MSEANIRKVLQLGDDPEVLANVIINNGSEPTNDRNCNEGGMCGWDIL
ncbi:hypothetical protein ACFSO7_15150 [Bacillus sp. CGMCC 1.16607]